LEGTAELAQLIESFEMEPSEAELKNISKEMQGNKGRAKKTAKAFLSSDNPLIADKAFRVIWEVTH
jgi:hypothetical protein